MKNFINYNNFNDYIKNNYNQKYENNLDLFDPYQGFIRGNLFKNLYNQYKISRPYEIEPMNEQADKLTYINSLEFATHELNLYLDIFPNDSNALNQFNNYNIELKKEIDEYEKKYGALFVNCLFNNNWSWDNNPWPWEN